MWRSYLKIGLHSLAQSRAYTFVAASLIPFAIGTVAAHAIRIARTNPINTLRYE